MAIVDPNPVPEESRRDFPHRSTSSAELVDLLYQRYGTDGTFDPTVVFEIIDRFMVSEGLATNTGRFEGPYYVDTF